MEFKQLIPYAIQITPTQNSGIFVRVGCAELVYGGTQKEINRFIRDLKEYLTEPHKVEKEYNEMHADRNRLRPCTEPMSDMPQGQTFSLAPPHEPPSFQEQPDVNEARTAEVPETAPQTDRPVPDRPDQSAEGQAD